MARDDVCAPLVREGLVIFVLLMQEAAGRGDGGKTAARIAWVRGASVCGQTAWAGILGLNGHCQ